MLDRELITWRTYDDRDILIKDLSVRHLVNILNWMIDANSDPEIKSYQPELVALMVNEAKLRVMGGFAANKGIPHQTGDGRWSVINQTPKEKVREDAQSAIHRELMRQQSDKIEAERAELLHHFDAEKQKLLAKIRK